MGVRPARLLVAIVSLIVGCCAVPAAAAPACATPATLRTSPDHPQVLVPDCTDGGQSLFPTAIDVVTAPVHGAVLHHLMFGYDYQPAHGFTGTDSFTYRVYSNGSYSAPVTQDVSVVANNPPDCEDQGVRLRTGGTRFLQLGCTDPDGDTVQSTIVQGPQHGLIAGTNAYTADDDFTGDDTVVLQATDAHGATSLQHVTITIVGSAGDTAPSCPDSTLLLYGSAPAVIHLSCTDAENDRLTYSSGQPSHGTLEDLGGGMVRYTPDSGFSGDDTFTFSATDGDRTSAIGTYTVSVIGNVTGCRTQSNVAIRPGKTFALNTPCLVNGSPVTPTITSSPADGTASVSGPSIIYTAPGSATGLEHIGFRGSDSTVYTQDVTVTDAANQAPTCNPPELPTSTRGAAVSVALNCSDADGDTLTYLVSQPPAHGTLSSVSGGSVTYTPGGSFTGTDSFDLTVGDGHGGQTDVLRRVVVRDAGFDVVPDCESGASYGGSVNQTIPLSFLFCGDADGDTVTRSMVAGPQHGTIDDITSPTPVYTPAHDFVGTDGFTYAASDGHFSTPPVAVTLDVGNFTYVPKCWALAARVREGVARPLSLVCDYIFTTGHAQIDTPPGHGQLSAVDGHDGVTYTPDPGYVGDDSFTYSASGDAEATVQLTVVHYDPPPATTTPPAGTDPTSTKTTPPPPAPPTQQSAPPASGATGGSPSVMSELDRRVAQAFGGPAIYDRSLALGSALGFVPQTVAGGTVGVAPGHAQPLIGVVCPAACSLAGTETIVFAGTRARAASVVRLPRQTRVLAPGLPGVVRLRVSPALARRMRQARRVTLKVGILVRFAGGAKARTTRGFRLIA